MFNNVRAPRRRPVLGTPMVHVDLTLLAVFGFVLMSCGPLEEGAEPTEPGDQVGATSLGLTVVTHTECPASPALGNAGGNVVERLHVGGSSEMVTAEDALECLSDKRLLGPVEIVLAPGVYRPYANAEGTTQPLVINHPEAHLLTIRGETSVDVPLMAPLGMWSAVNASGVTSFYYAFYRLASNDWNVLVDALGQMPEGQDAFVMLRRTREGGADHAIHRGVWQVDPLTLQYQDMLVVRHRYQPQRLDELKSDDNSPTGVALPPTLDAAFSTEPGKEPRAVLLTTVLSFRCSAGMLVKGTELHSLQNLAIVGDYDPASRPGLCPDEKRRMVPENVRLWSQIFPGVETRRGGGANLTRVGVANMDGQGVSARPGSWLVAHRTAASGNARRGFYSTLNAAMSLTETIASGNSADGYVADHSATLNLSGVSAVGNSEHGINALMRGEIAIQETASSRNGNSGFAGIGGGKLWFGGGPGQPSSHALGNGRAGLFLQGGALASAQSLKLQNNGSQEGCSGAPMGVCAEAGATWAFDSATVDNRDLQDIDPQAHQSEVLECAAIVRERRFFTARAVPHTARASESEEPAYPKENVVIDSEYDVLIDPNSSSDGLSSLHEFFHGSHADSIKGKRIMLASGADIPEPAVKVKLVKGVHTFEGGPLLINHPDAGRVHIFGESRRLNIVSSGDLTACNANGGKCTEVELTFITKHKLAEGDFLALDHSRGSGSLGHHKHLGIWQVSAALSDTTLRVRNLGAALKGFGNNDGLAQGNELLGANTLETVLYFPGVGGKASPGLVVDGTSLGLLKDVVIVGSRMEVPGSSPSNTTHITAVPPAQHDRCTAMGYGSEVLLNIPSGLKVQNCGVVELDRVAVTGFEGAGLTIAQNGLALERNMSTGWAPGPILSSYNERGFLALNEGGLLAKRSIASANDKEGYLDQGRSMMSVALGASVLNGQEGFEVRGDSHLDASNSVAVVNGRSGFRVNASSASLTGHGDCGEGNCTVAYSNADYGFQIEAGSYVALDKAWAVLHNTDNRAGLHASGESVCRSKDILLVGNDWGMKVVSGAVVNASGASCFWNTTRNQYIQSSAPAGVLVGGCE